MMKQYSTQNLLELAKDSLVSRRGIVNSLHLTVSPHNPTLYIAYATRGAVDGFSDPVASYDPYEAQFRAIMNTVAEHASFSRPKRTAVFRADKLTCPFLNPKKYFPIDESRAMSRFIRPFSTKKQLHWLIGMSYDGRPVYIPEDFVYRGNARDFIYFANESGVAAHPDKITSIKLATISRLKADAVMSTWYKQLSPYTIDPQYMPKIAQLRIENWRKIGRTLTVGQLDNGYGEVYLATIRGEEWPCFACGVGITLDKETDIAIMNAIAEAEKNFELLEGYPEDSAPTNECAIESSLDHGLYYGKQRNVRVLDFLTSRKELSRPFARAENFDELVHKLSLKLYWLSNESASYHVVRVFSPFLVPISYGYGLEHPDHVSLRNGNVQVSEKACMAPHCFMCP